ncbi:biogenesis of lysosome-related organelles complex 1 subunit 4 [Hippopotamus amphibius kiboko]|uniref:biogenesis of lysosome-related organelles complex 1 subunit 4 n=1 Tax=Hippopotamus amphibius kiboko TaxID=575201 RepID=UPI0025973C6D|nr:biogenesis of lysosome-related organelles complex 1 subunit 4 [Hippopotamus amphibius kiboko]
MPTLSRNSCYTFILLEAVLSASTCTRRRARARVSVRRPEAETGARARARGGPDQGRARGGARVRARAEAGRGAVRAHARARAEAGSGAGRRRDMEGSPPAEEADPQGAAWSGDSGRVSQSQSSASGPWEEDEGPEAGAPSRALPLLRRAAAGYAACLLPGAGVRPEVGALDASLEALLTRVDEFVGMLDMLRGDSSHVVREGVPRIHAKAAEMRRVYGRIDRLEAFVGMVGASVARLEEQVARAEAELGALPGPLRRLLRTVRAPSFFGKAPAGASQQAGYEPPVVFRTEDHFPCCGGGPQA